MSFFFWAAVLVFILLMTSKHRFHAVMLAVFGIVVMIVLGVMSLLMGRQENNHQAPAASAVVEVKANKAEQVSADPSLESLWDKLTKSRINLDNEAESAPLADPKNEDAKQAFRERFGLDENGNMPPKWVVTPPKRVGEVLRETVASDPFVTAEECRRQLEQEQLPHIVARQIGYLASAKLGRSVRIVNPLEVGIGLDYILREVCRDEFVGTTDTSVGEMKIVHVLLEFNTQVDQHLTAAWLQHERHERFAAFGKMAAMSLIGLATIYGLLRFDTWSQGYYSKQLLVGGVLAIIAFAVVFLQS